VDCETEEMLVPGNYISTTAASPSVIDLFSLQSPRLFFFSLNTFTPIEPSGRELVDGDLMGPIAVVGLSLKFPQEATSPEAFWKMLMEKRCAMTEVPSDRLNVDAFQGTDTNRTDQVRVLPLSYYG
jgi:hypothetical protein